LSMSLVALVRWDELRRYAVARRVPWPLSGPPGAFTRPSRFPMYIGLVCGFCMGVQGA
jgi:hypothetical protein